MKIIHLIAPIAVLMYAANAGAFGDPAKAVPSAANASSVSQPVSPAAAAPAPVIETIKFSEFLEATPKELRPTAKLLKLNGKHVRIVGFMTQTEEPPKGSFYLVPTPVFSDEEGGGTADLPPQTVRVIVRSSKGQEIPFVARPIEVTGILEVGNHVDDDGQVSAIRLILDRKEDIKSTGASQASKPTTVTSNTSTGQSTTTAGK